MRTMSYTGHAWEWQAQRILSAEDVQFVWEYERAFRCDDGALGLLNQP